MSLVMDHELLEEGVDLYKDSFEVEPEGKDFLIESGLWNPDLHGFFGSTDLIGHSAGGDRAVIGPETTIFDGRVDFRVGSLLAGVKGAVTTTKHDTTAHHRTKPQGWLSITNAAELLDVRPEALRRRIERAARLAADGVMEAEVDGVRARKLGRSWRVHLGSGWQIEIGDRASAKTGAGLEGTIAQGGSDGRS